MIRRRLQRRWMANKTPAERLLCSFREITYWPWIDRYHAWHVRSFGDHGVGDPWWDRWIVGPFMLWLTDWRQTLVQRRPYDPGEVKRIADLVKSQEAEEG